MTAPQILLVAEHDHATLKAVNHNCLAAAQCIGNTLDVAVVGCNARAVAQQAATLPGVRTIKLVDAPHYAAQTAESAAEILVTIIRAGGYSHVLAAASSFGKNLLPRIAALLDVAPVSDVCAVIAPDTFVHPIYAGNALETVQSSDAIKVMTVRSSAFTASSSAHAPSAAPIETVAAGPEIPGVRFLERAATPSTRPELGAARVVVSGGRGLGSADNYHALLEPLADVLEAALGASRAAVDAGFVGNDYQVGQTGKVVAPQLYLAIGISGAIQHLAGMKDSKVIVAINKDADAPIFQVADYGLVGDLFQIVPELTDKIARRSG